MRQCYGMANRADDIPVSPRTRFSLGSMTKLFTAMTLLRLRDDGAVELTTPVVDILPPTSRPRTLRSDVTVGHLLTHTSGIADYFEEETVGDDWPTEFAALWSDLPVYRVTRPHDVLPLFSNLDPYRSPGATFQYSNAGYVLAGLVIEVVGDMPYTEAVQRCVFDPALMTDSGFFAADEVRPLTATGYLPPSEPGKPWRTNVFAMPSVGGPDGGAFSNVGDLERLVEQFESGRVVSPATVTEALSPQAEIDETTATGYGMFLAGEGRARYWYSEGADPGAEALLWRFPDLDVAAVVLSNVNDYAWDIGEAIVDTIKGAAD